MQMFRKNQIVRVKNSCPDAGIIGAIIQLTEYDPRYSNHNFPYCGKCIDHPVSRASYVGMNFLVRVGDIEAYSLERD